MCGIAGYIDFRRTTSSEVIIRITESLYHRGPDDKGHVHLDTPNAIIGLSHTRLSIIDTSPAGHQPMHYKKLSIVFNGEIYNYKEIKEELLNAGHCFVSDSDTEVILHAYEKWGTDFVHRLIGMFVIVIYDRENEKVLIYRDRTGIKPLFYYWHNDLFLFGSELKSLMAHYDFVKEIDINVVALYFDLGYIPAPYSIFKYTHKIEPGKFLEINLKQKQLSQFTYWKVDDYYLRPKYRIDYSEAKERVGDLLVSSCNYRMVADVPVGIFLSGGYDSSVVAAILQTGRTEKLKTFTIGFNEGNNEAPYAKEVAKFLGTDHTEYTCTTREAQDIIPELPYYFDEPFADSSAIPTILVSKVARRDVKVAISADGGDEVFAGYARYEKFHKNVTLLGNFPSSSKYLMKPCLRFLSDITPIMQSELKHKFKSIADALSQDSYFQAQELYRFASTLPHFYYAKMFNYILERYPTKYNGDFSKFDNVIDIALAIDYEMYLQNDIMAKVDRATMSVSLEGREPLLDHRLAEFVIQLPIDFKFNRQGGKRILKDIAHDYIPKILLERPKAGFSLPIYSWLIGDLKYLIEEYLSEKSISESGIFNVGYVSRLVEAFKKKRFYYKPIIWNLLMFQMWYFKWMK